MQNLGENYTGFRRSFLIVFCSIFILVRTSEEGEGDPNSGIRKRFEYKLSFKGPHLVQNDGLIPYWQHYGDTIASDESVRITPSLKSKKGSVWSKELNTHEDWEIELVFRVIGRGRVGADGLALWYSDIRGEEGPVFGSKDNWNGLGIFFDSFDNDGLRNNPYIMAMVNDGTKTYQHMTDGGGQEVGGCQRDFRNKQFPVRARIEYYKKSLTVYINNGVTADKDNYEICFKADGVALPPSGYLGVSAATGDLADDHDVLALLTYSLKPAGDLPESTKPEVPEEMAKKFEKEFSDYQEKLDKAKEEYKKEHPQQPGTLDTDALDDKMYDAADVRELRMIYDGQNAMHQLLKTLLLKFEDVVGRQERGLSLLTSIHQKYSSGVPPQVDNNQQQLSTGGDTIQRHEVNSMLQSHQELSNNIRDIRVALGDVQAKMGVISSGGQQGGGMGAETGQALRDMRTYVTYLQNDVKQLLARPQAATNCPQEVVVNCVTTTYLLVFLFLQLVCIIAYMMYRDVTAIMPLKTMAWVTSSSLIQRSFFKF